LKTKLPIYGLVAILSAIVLAAFAYNFPFHLPEFQPFQPFQPQQPGQPEQPGQEPHQPQQQQPTVQSFLKAFTSYEHLKNFLSENSYTSGSVQILSPLDVEVIGTKGLAEQSDVAPTADYSATNIQVAGVDEADVVKTDGRYIYTVSGNAVYIVDAYPPKNASVVSRITLGNDTCLAGMFVDGDRLAVLGSKYDYYPISYYAERATKQAMFMPFFVDVKTFVQVYNIADRKNPDLVRNFTITGSYFSSRMVGDYVYFVASQPAYVLDDVVILPRASSGNASKEFEPSEIYYSDVKDSYFAFTTVVALNLQNESEEPNHLTLMLGSTSHMYMSLNNMYITFPDYFEGKTSIYRIRIQNRTLTTEAQGKVPGNALNQFCMDEFNNYFRIATATWINGTAQSNLYVLDMDLKIVGSLERIEPGETMDSARFMGNRAYLSTSVVRRDPFFVIDLTDPANPQILGNLTIPGFNRYLHPYDDNHVIGVGRDGDNHVKISLFDVTNVGAPINISSYTFPGDWSDTPVLTDHKAFLFDKSKELLVIPASYYQNSGVTSWWQEAYVFKVTLSEGIHLRDTITHEGSTSGTVYWDASYWVKRALYIDNVLYTVSDKKIKMNDLDSLALLNQLILP
jgi:uncharacterized secreted protein with C-terminal beta-propeller domain